jgi:hypothetical protein
MKVMVFAAELLAKAKGSAATTRATEIGALIGSLV